MQWHQYRSVRETNRVFRVRLPRVSFTALIRFAIHSVALLTVLLATTVAQADPPNEETTESRTSPRKNDGNKNAAAFVKKCKAATALVHVKNLGTGSAFCISKEGIFLTNRHVVGHFEVGASVELVLNSGEKNERVVQAKIVHLSPDETVDLAILKMDKQKDLTVLNLGDDSQLVETATVTAFGFPFGQVLAGKGQRYPNVTVTSGKVSSLRRSADRLEVIQVDAAVNPGCSGGPLVDQRGNVVGVVFAAMLNSGIAFAIPVSAVHNYLKTPHITLNCPEVSYAKRFTPLKVEVALVELTPGPKAALATLKLHPESETPKVIPLEKKDDHYEASVTLFEKSKIPEQLSLRIQREKNVTQAHITDQLVRLAKEDYPLSSLRLIQRRGEMRIVTTNEGKKFATADAELPTVKLDNGIDLDLRQVDQIWLATVNSADSEASYEVTVERGGEIVASLTGRIQCTGRPSQMSAEYSDGNAIDEPATEEIIVEAAVQGKSSLMVYLNGLWWEHQGQDLPGTKEGSQSYVLVNGKKWSLRWMREDADKSVTAPLLFKVGGLNHDVRLLSIREQPNGPNRPERGGIEFHQNNGVLEPTRITFNNSQPGTSIYRISIRHHMAWTIPAPVADRVSEPTSAHWSFDQDSAEIIHDAFDNKNDGYGPSPTFVNGLFGRALALDGGCVNCGKIGKFDRNSNFSLGGWIYLTQLTGTMPIIAHMGSRIGHRGYDLSAGSKLSMQLFHSLDSGNGIKVSSVEPLSSFRWYHVFATYDGTGSSSGVHLYIDGVPVAVFVEMDRLSETIQVDAPLQLGMRHPVSPTAEPFRGRIAEIRLYDRVLLADEIQELYLEKRGGTNLGEMKSLRDNLIGAWIFDDPKLSRKRPVEDRSGRGHPGTIEFQEKDISFVPGKSGKALSLNNRVVKFGPATGDFERTDAFSYGCWVNRTDKSNQALFSKLEHRDPLRGYDLMIQNGKPRMSLTCSWVTGHDEPLRSILVFGDVPVPPNEWHHLLTTYDGSSKAAGVKIYLDGRPIGTKVECDSLDGSIRTVTPLCLGNRFNDPGAAFDGLIDDAVIYSRRLTQAEVVDLMNGNLPKP
jgi:S1-C subfamily serine protease